MGPVRGQQEDRIPQGSRLRQLPFCDGHFEPAGQPAPLHPPHQIRGLVQHLEPRELPGPPVVTSSMHSAPGSKRNDFPRTTRESVRAISLHAHSRNHYKWLP